MRLHSVITLWLVTYAESLHTSAFCSCWGTNHRYQLYGGWSFNSSSPILRLYIGDVDVVTDRCAQGCEPLQVKHLKTIATMQITGQNQTNKQRNLPGLQKLHFQHKAQKAARVWMILCLLYCIKHLGCSYRVERHYISTSPFTIYL